MKETTECFGHITLQQNSKNKQSKEINLTLRKKKKKNQIESFINFFFNKEN